MCSAQPYGEVRGDGAGSSVAQLWSRAVILSMRKSAIALLWIGSRWSIGLVRPAVRLIEGVTANDQRDSGVLGGYASPWGEAVTFRTTERGAIRCSRKHQLRPLLRPQGKDERR